MQNTLEISTHWSLVQLRSALDRYFNYAGTRRKTKYNYIFVVYYTVRFFYFYLTGRVNKRASRRIGARATSTKN